MRQLNRIVAAMGGTLLEGGRRALIPGPGHSPKDRSVSLRMTEDGRLLIHCFSPQDNWRNVRAALAAKGLLDAAPRPASAYSQHVAAAPAGEDRLRIARAHRWWEESRPITGTVAECYFHNRAIASRPWNANTLRFHPRMTSVDDRVRRPALVAALRNAAGDLQGVQATLLSAHGAYKAAIPTPRRVIGRLLGGTVKLGTASSALIIAEGIETALSASDALGLPAWAALTARNLARFEPPQQITHLVIAADNDPAGRAASRTLRARLLGTIRTGFVLPPGSCNDWNDWACMSRQTL